MCCCCPPAVSALFCLWTQSGCAKGTVAGALTFFPPEPPLYQFERKSADGRVLDPGEDAGDGHTQNGNSSPATKGTITEQSSSEDPPEAKTEGQTQEKLKSPMQQLTEQAAFRRKRAKERADRDQSDFKHNVSYSLLLDPRLQVPAHDEGAIEAVKIPAGNGVYVAAVVYRATNPTSQTRTIVYSHGNATDIGAMFPIQVVLSHSLDANVVVYDYSGYGESGGVPLEASTYRDIEAVYEYVLENLAYNSPRNVVLYGQSVGGGPCCYLAAQEPDLGGIVLHSAFTSGMRVLTPSR